ncbi:hypothetical protein LWI29_001095 [Acer saccharum]|uniref:DUF4378 domain-containing protein n=1 Tax=Acer saccharum TaxID=4024 RepID=A0AA39W0K6_ACESA|nr:hypothetical protein LWI29_001095 [Acer saccharum]
MEVEKKRSKGGFLNLFDWNGKSRKKLFSNNPELDDESKKGKENVGKKSLLHVIEVDESRGSLSNKGSSEFNCSSSVTSDEGSGARAPGVVARLMGLDSMPTSNVPEACSDPYRDLHCFRASQYNRSDPNSWSENQPVDYLSMPNRECLSWNPVESRVRKVQNRPIERFQTEILPPKSAKSIPFTHHKLLSPIKNPGFIPTKNTAYIMEAAAKIIEASPQSTAKSRRPSVASSVPLKIWDLKDKMEAAHIASRPQKSNEPVAVRYTKGQNSDQSHSEPKSAPVVKASMNPQKRSSDNVRKKGKLVSLGEQSKVNVQRREGSTSTSSSSRSSMQKKEKCDVKANQFSKSQPDTQKAPQKGTAANRTNNGTFAKKTNNALRQNNQKQNYMPHKDSSNSKTPVNNQQNRKTKSIGGSNGPNGTLNKFIANSETESRKTGSTKNDTGKELSSSRAKNLTQKKQSMNGDSRSEENNDADNVLNKKDERSIKCNVAVDGCMNWSTDNRKKGMDIVSFTFSSPIRSMTDPQSSGQVMEKTNSFNIDSFGDNNQRRYLKNLAFSSPGCNVIGADALSALLEQKLRELACKVESSNCNVIREGSTDGSASNLQDLVPTLGVVSMNSAEHGQRLQIYRDKDTSDSLDNSCCTSIDSPELKINQKWQFQHSEEMEKGSSDINKNETGREFDCQHSSSVSSLEPSFMSVYCSDNENSTGDSKQFSLAQDLVEICWRRTNVCQLVESETKLSDSASSKIAGDIGERHTSRTFSFVDVKESGNWELDYVREILGSAELMVHEFAFGQTDQVITPNFFNHLESQENVTGRNDQEQSKLGRKALFDCICECLDIRCQQLFVGSCKVRCNSSSTTLFQRKSRLAEELYKEIESWKGMGDLMVDDLVDKDMSTQNGKWIDFDIEALEEGVEIENEILTSLVDELLSDFLVF